MAIEINSIIPQYLLEALGATLLHSVWQGAILAALTGLLIPATAKASAAKRYQLLVMMLLLFCGSVAVTFIYQLPLQVSADSVVITVTGTDHHPQAKLITTNNIWQNTLLFVRKHNATIVWIWLAVVVVRALQLAIGLRGINRLKQVGLTPVNRHWTERLAEITETLGIKRAVRLAESTLANVPMVVGHLKPLILLPIGLLTALSAAEVEAILAHELAHVRRKDYLSNLFLSLVEILFFFNPAVLWLAALIKAEREHCCDDIAVKITQSKVAYIKALVACEELQQQTPAFAMAFTGRGGLFARTSRLLAGTKPTLNRTEKSLVAACLLGVLLLSSAFSYQQEIKKAATKAVAIVDSIAAYPKLAKFDTVAAVAPAATPSQEVEAKPVVTLQKETAVNDTSVNYKVNYPVDTITNKNYSSNINKNYNQNNNAGYNINLNKNAGPLNSRLDSIRSVTTPAQKTGIAVPVPASNNDAVIQLASGDEKNTNDIAVLLATKMLQSGLTDNVKSYKMTANELVLNDKKLSDADFDAFKEKNIKFFHQGTTVYYKFNSREKHTKLQIKD